MEVEKLRQLVRDSVAARCRMTLAQREHYSPPPEGGFVGERTKFVVIEPSVLGALLDIAEEFRGVASNPTTENLCLEARVAALEERDTIEQMERGRIRRAAMRMGAILDAVDEPDEGPKSAPVEPCRCDHACMRRLGHDGPHWHGYVLGPSVAELQDEVARAKGLLP